MEHWNIQLNIQKVTEEPERSGNPLARGMAPVKKATLSVAEIKVSAETEAEAFAKVRRLLDATQTPASYGVANPEFSPHQHRASCHGAIGELLCGEETAPRPRPIRDNPQA